MLTAAQITERGWLHAAMVRGGFRGIPTEWWHYELPNAEDFPLIQEHDQPFEH